MHCVALFAGEESWLSPYKSSSPELSSFKLRATFSVPSRSKMTTKAATQAVGQLLFSLFTVGFAVTSIEVSSMPARTTQAHGDGCIEFSLYEMLQGSANVTSKI